MKKNRFHIAVAILAGFLLIAVSIAHACVRTAGAHGARDYSGIQAAGLVRASHSETPDAGCSSIRDRLLSLAPERPFYGMGSTVDLQAMPAVAGLPLTESCALSAEGHPWCRGNLDSQARPYLFNSVLRI
jgi:hypothetical protein